MSLSSKAFWAVVVLVVLVIVVGQIQKHLPAGSPNPIERIADTNKQRLHDVGTTLENAG